jgi:putative DNA-invertase from lambdoid prophage Rac
MAHLQPPRLLGIIKHPCCRKPSRPSECPLRYALTVSVDSDDRSGDTLVVRWVDRLGRNYEDICETIREFMRRGVVIRTVINGITFDGATKDAMQRAVRDALIAFMAATAQAQAEATKEAQRAGIAHAKANGDARAYKGRKPSYSRKQFESAQAMLGKSSSVGEIAGSTGLTRQTVYRIKDDPVGAEAALATWGV